MDTTAKTIAIARMDKLNMLVAAKEKADAIEKEARKLAEHNAREAYLAEYQHRLPELGMMAEYVAALCKLGKLDRNSPIWARDRYIYSDNPNDFGVYSVNGLYGFAYIRNACKHCRNDTYFFVDGEIRRVYNASSLSADLVVGNPLSVTEFKTETLAKIVENMARTIAAVNEMVDKL